MKIKNQQKSIKAMATDALAQSEFRRLPRPKERDALSGLSRTTMLQYGEEGCFKLIRLIRPGGTRGIVLVDTKSFLAWLHGQPSV